MKKLSPQETITLSLRPLITDTVLNEKCEAMWQERREKRLAEGGAKSGVQTNGLREYREYKAKALK